MKFNDIIRIAFQNLVRNRLRSVLTIFGVVVGIAALTTLMAFGFGMQKNVTEEVSKSFILSEITFHEKEGANHQQINDSVLHVLSADKRINYVIENKKFPALIAYSEQQNTGFVTTIKEANQAFVESLDFSTKKTTLKAGNQTALVSNNFLHKLISKSDTNLRDAEIDSLVTASVGKKINIGSVVFDPMKIMMGMTFGGFSPEKLIRDTSVLFQIAGVYEHASFNPIFADDLIVLEEETKQLPKTGFTDIWQLLEGKPGANKRSALVKVDKFSDIEPVNKWLADMGFSTNSLLDQLEEIKKVFLIFDSLISIFGIIALFIATLGIVNTLLMSIYERTKEIGILQSLGASTQEIKRSFILESALIGFIGAAIGVPLSYGVSRIIGLVMNNMVMKDVKEYIELFEFSFILILFAFAFSILISVLAGLYPAARAAKVDPIKALRHD